MSIICDFMEEIPYRSMGSFVAGGEAAARMEYRIIGARVANGIRMCRWEKLSPGRN